MGLVNSTQKSVSTGGLFEQLLSALIRKQGKATVAFPELTVWWESRCTEDGATGAWLVLYWQ